MCVCACVELRLRQLTAPEVPQSVDNAAGPETGGRESPLSADDAGAVVPRTAFRERNFEDPLAYNRRRLEPQRRAVHRPTVSLLGPLGLNNWFQYFMRKI